MEPLTNEYLIKLVDDRAIEKIKKDEEVYQLNKDTYKLHWRKFFHDKDLRPIKDIYDDVIRLANADSEWSVLIFKNAVVPHDFLSKCGFVTVFHFIRSAKEVLYELYGDIFIKYFPTADFNLKLNTYYEPVLRFKLMRAVLL